MVFPRRTFSSFGPTTSTVRGNSEGKGAIAFSLYLCFTFDENYCEGKNQAATGGARDSVVDEETKGIRREVSGKTTKAALSNRFF